MKRFLILVVCLILGACAHRNPLSNMSFQTVMAPPYVVAGWYKITDPGEPIKVYIEGDGHAFNEDGQPTDNPTPRGEFMRRLAAGDPSPNVAYLGRPCQFLQTEACTVADWTVGRFSDSVITAMDSAVAAMMKKARTNQVILVGFSGGAQVAGLVAVRHPNRVKRVITVAGVLDHAAWTAYHGDPPLTRSLNLADSRTAFLALPQTHYAGGKDTVIPAALIQDFAGSNHVVIVPGAGHGTGFSKIYSKIYQGE